MRRTPPVRRTAPVVVAAMVLLPACGASGETGSAASGSSRPSSGASESAGEGGDPGFCADAAAVQERVGSALGRQSDPAALPQTLRQAATDLRAVEPPEEIAADWNALANGVEQVATALSSTDFEDPTGRATFEEQVRRLEAGLTSASANVAEYLRDECGIAPGMTSPAAPTG